MGQCVGIEAVQFCVISLPVKSSIIGVIQEFTNYKMASGVGCLTEVPDLVKTTRHRVGRPRKHRGRCKQTYLYFEWNTSEMEDDMRGTRLTKWWCSSMLFASTTWRISTENSVPWCSMVSVIFSTNLCNWKTLAATPRATHSVLHHWTAIIRNHWLALHHFLHLLTTLVLLKSFHMMKKGWTM